MGYSIKIKDRFHYHRSIVFGLEIQGSSAHFPLLVGCSLLTPKGEEVDLPARWIKKSGRALWKIEPNASFVTNPKADMYDKVWAGRIIFALWENDTFTKRLADTGWVNWQAQSLIGSSTAGMDMQDDRIKREYGGLDDAWKNNDPLGIR